MVLETSNIATNLKLPCYDMTFLLNFGIKVISECDYPPIQSLVRIKITLKLLKRNKT